MIYVADTHSLIWFLTDDKKLGNKAKEVLEKADEGKLIIIVPTIVLAELVFICEKKDASVKFKDVMDKINERSNLTQIPEMHDRIITATAKLNRAVLITKDPDIVEAGIIETIW